MAATRPRRRAVAPGRQPPQVGPRCEIDRGPNWLFVRVDSTQLTNPSASVARRLADHLWSICDRHFTYRLVVEVARHDAVSLEMATALAALAGRLHERGGALRVCGLGAAAEQTPSRGANLDQASGAGRLDPAHRTLHTFDTRREAVLASECHGPVVRAK